MKSNSRYQLPTFIVSFLKSTFHPLLLFRHFSDWCDERRLELAEIEAISVATYIKQFGTKARNRTVKQHPAAIRQFVRLLEHWWHPGGQPGSLARHLSRHHPPLCESGPLRPAPDARHHPRCPMSKVRRAAIGDLSGGACPARWQHGAARGGSDR